MYRVDIGHEGRVGRDHVISDDLRGRAALVEEDRDWKIKCIYLVLTLDMI